MDFTIVFYRLDGQGHATESLWGGEKLNLLGRWRAGYISISPVYLDFATPRGVSPDEAG